MKRPLRFTLIWASFAATFAVLASSAYAGAFTYYASPTGSGNCESAATPCKIEKAVAEAVNEDSVVVEPGTYTLTASLGISKAINIGGQPGASPPIIATTATKSMFVSASAKSVLHDLRIEGAGPLILGSGAAERLFVSFNGTSSSGCDLNPGTSLIDSVCWAHNGSGGSSPISTDGTTTGTITLRNVTAVSANSSATAIYGGASSGGHLTVNATNLIAIGNNHPDIEAIPSAGGSTVINLTHSDYRTIEQSTSPPGTVTAPGTNGNITALPTFASAATGNFTELAGSPTIDTGLNDPLNGATDLAGNPRSLGICVGGPGVTDIGAYEFVPTAACPAPPPSPGKIKLGKLRLNKKNGTATLTVILTGAGKLTLSGKGAKKVTRTAKAATTLKLPIKAVGKQRKTLDEVGGLKLSLKLKFTPVGGAATSLTKKLTLREIVR